MWPQSTDCPAGLAIGKVLYFWLDSRGAGLGKFATIIIDQFAFWDAVILPERTICLIKNHNLYKCSYFHIKKVYFNVYAKHLQYIQLQHKYVSNQSQNEFSKLVKSMHCIAAYATTHRTIAITIYEWDRIHGFTLHTNVLSLFVRRGKMLIKFLIIWPQILDRKSALAWWTPYSWYTRIHGYYVCIDISA